MNRKAFIIAPGMSREQQTALCARMCEEMCGKRIAAGEVSIMPPCTPKAADTAAAEAANRRIVYLAAAGKNDRACFAYTEMSMVSGAYEEADTAPECEFGTEEADNSTELHRYYIRFAGDSRGWLDIVTDRREGDARLTKPISVKALHGWLKHALAFDPEAFAAAIAD